MITAFKIALLLTAATPSAGYVSMGNQWRVAVPEAWTVVGSDGNAFVLSRDGPGIQSIRGRCRSRQAPFAVFDEALSSDDSMVDHAQKISAGLLRSYAASAPKLEAVEPVQLGVRKAVPGLLFTLQFSNDKGVAQVLRSAFFMHRDAVCSLDFQAPGQYFVKRDRSAFAAVLSSLRRR